MADSEARAIGLFAFINGKMYHVGPKMSGRPKGCRVVKQTDAWRIEKCGTKYYCALGGELHRLQPV